MKRRYLALLKRKVHGSWPAPTGNIGRFLNAFYSFEDRVHKYRSSISIAGPTNETLFHANESCTRTNLSP